MNTRRVLRTSLVAFAASALALLNYVAPANANSTQRPFAGQFAGQAVVNIAAAGSGCTNPPLQTTTDATGTVTHLGRTVMHTVHCTPTIDAVKAGQATLTAANGDKVMFAYNGTCSPPPFPPVIKCHLTYTITGGTGRFQNARGSGSFDAQVNFSGSLELPTVLPGTWVMHGWISY